LVEAVVAVVEYCFGANIIEDEEENGAWGLRLLLFD
jgi:hypothetical protein